MFKDIFEEIERLTIPDQLGVEGYGIQLSSLEDVFSKMVSKKMPFFQPEEKRVSIAAFDCNKRSNYSGCSLINSQTSITYFKKITYMKRHWSDLMWLFIITLISNLFLFRRIIEQYGNLVQLEFNWDSYDQQKIVFAAHRDESFIRYINLTTLSSTLRGPNYPQLKPINASRVKLDDIILRSKLVDVLNLYVGGIILEKNKIEIIYNPSFLHAVPNMINSVCNVLAKLLLSPESRITTYNDPVPYKIKTQMLMRHNKSLFYVLIFHTIYTVLLSFFAFMPTKERLIGMKVQQLMAGLSARIYWIVHLHIDISVFMILAIIPAAVLTVSGNVVGSQHLIEYFTLYLIIFLGGTSGLAYLYSLTKVMKHGITCATIFNCFWFITGPVLLFIMTPLSGYKSSQGIWCTFFDCFVWFPSYASSSALFKTIKLMNQRRFCNGICKLRGPDLPGCTVELLCSEHFQENSCCGEFFKFNINYVQSCLFF